MRPTPSELIYGVRRILSDVIAPDLRSEYAQVRLREIRAVLAQVDWNDVALDHLRSSMRIAGVVVDVADWLRVAPGSDDRRTEALSRLPDEELQMASSFGVGPPRFVTLDRCRNRLSEWLFTTVDVLDDRIAAHPGDELAVGLRREIYEVLLGEDEQRPSPI